MSGNDELQRRKDRHLDVVLEEDVDGLAGAVGLGRYTLEYDGLPEVDLDEVDLATTALGRQLAAPLVVGAMTGGTDRAGAINRVLARAAARVGVGMALGSQRAMLVRPETTPSFAVKDAAPDLPLLFGNVGAVQLNYGLGAADLRRAAVDVGADALNVHLNPLQEAIQPEGDTRFRGLHGRLRAALPEVGVPCVIKEVGAGISARTVRKLLDLPIAGIEIAGTGGTSWAAVEAHRAAADPKRAAAGLALAGFGVPTAASLGIVRAAAPDLLVVASGGIRTGMDVAVSLALGADLVALARPLLQAAVHGEDAVVAALEALIFEVRVIAFCCGARSLAELRRVRVIDVRAGWPTTA